MRYRYTRYTGEGLEGIDLDELVSKLSRLLLSSGFDSPYGPYGNQEEDDRSLQSLHDAILDALLNEGLLPDDAVQDLEQRVQTAERVLVVNTLRDLVFGRISTGSVVGEA